LLPAEEIDYMTVKHIVLKNTYEEIGFALTIQARKILMPKEKDGILPLKLPKKENTDKNMIKHIEMKSFKPLLYIGPK